MPGGGSEDGGSEDSGSQGEESPSGSEESTSSGESGSPGGEIGSFPSEDPMGVPPPPSSAGGGAGEEGEESGSADAGDGDSAGDSEWEDEGGGDSECGDTGALPGGVGGMGQAGECIGGGASSSSESESSSESSASDSGGGAEGSSQGTGGAGSVGEFPEESDAERAQRLGRELDESVGGFDEVLQEEQREIAAAGRNTEGFGEGTTGGDGGISLGEQSGSGSGNRVAVANTTGMSRESPTAGMSQEEIRERTPEDIPVMVDDDIIARQLREAALAENDPALRERLWEEYRKYSGL